MRLAQSRLVECVVLTGYKTVNSNMAELDLGYDAPA
jgi:hypothetical protein